MKDFDWLSRLPIAVPEPPLPGTLALESAQSPNQAQAPSLPTLLGVVVAAILLFIAAIGAYGQNAAQVPSTASITTASPALH
jgi:hypothetical protein